MLHDEGGSALVELALVLSIFFPPLLLGVVDMSTVLFSSIEITNAAHTGALYGMTSLASASETSGIQSAAQADAPDFGTNLLVTPTIFYACSASEGGTQYTTTTAAAAACPANAANHYLEFVQVVASTTVTPPFKCPGFPATFNLSSTSVMEVEE